MRLSFIKQIALFYYDGFRLMTIGKTLWILILVKLFVIFFVLKLFFFKGTLSDLDQPQDKSNFVIEELIQRKSNR